MFHRVDSLLEEITQSRSKSMEINTPFYSLFIYDSILLRSYNLTATHSLGDSFLLQTLFSSSFHYNLPSQAQA